MKTKEYKELLDAEWEASESVLAAAYLVAETVRDDSPSMITLRAVLDKYRKAKGALDAADAREDERTERDRKIGL